MEFGIMDFTEAKTSVLVAVSSLSEHTIGIPSFWDWYCVTCTRHGHQNRVTVTRGCIDTIFLSWWWARCARNM